MEGGEINNFIKVWVTIIVSLCYCYALSKIVPKGFKRLLLILPIVSLFVYLPLNLYSIHLGGFTTFYIVWLGNFKLLLFAFGKGPLCLDPSISLHHFVVVSCLPIKLQGNPKPLKSQPNAQFIDPNPNPNGQNNENPSSKLHLNGLNRENPSPKSHQNGQIVENPSPKLHLNGLNSKNPSPKSHQNGQKYENSSPKFPLNGLNRENPSQKSQLNGQNGQTNENPSPKLHQNGLKRENSSQQNGEIQSPTKNDRMTRRKFKEWLTSYAMKGVLLAVSAKAYDYNDYFHPKIMLLIHQLHIYFILDLIFAMSATLARRFLGLELEPQFKEPYLATSLQDFWGKRWNLTVTSLLRPTVYEPTLKVCSIFVGRKTAMLAAVFNTFVVSGAMHEIMLYYYMGRSTTTWGITCFFLLNGCFTAVEIGLKTAFQGSGFEMPLWISRSLTLLFVTGTSIWLFLPEYKNCRVDVRAFEEYAAVGAFAKVVVEKIASRFRAG